MKANNWFSPFRIFLMRIVQAHFGFIFRLAFWMLLIGLTCAPAAAQRWSVDVLDASTVDREATGILDPAGTLAGSGGALIQDSTFSGVDTLSNLTGLYTVQIIDPTGGSGPIRIRIARTQRRD